MIDRLWVFNQHAAVNLLDYYTTIEIIISLFIAGLLALVYKNIHYSKQQKRSSYWSLGLLICIIVMFAIVSAYHQFEQRTFSGDCLFMFYTFFVVFLGIVIQEVSGGALRTTSLTIVIGMCSLLNRFNNFTQKVSDLEISRDNVVMRTDIMTGIVKARRLTVRACLGYLKLVFRG